MQVFVSLNCCVEELTSVCLQNVVHLLGILADIATPISECSRRELCLLVAKHNTELRCPHCRRKTSVLIDIANSPQILPRIREQLRRATICGTLRRGKLEICTRLFYALDCHVRDMVHIDNDIHHGIDCKTHTLIIVVSTIAKNLQSLLYLNISVVIVCRCRLEVCIEVEFLPTLGFEVATVLTQRGKELSRLGQVLANILLYQLKCFSIVVLRCEDQHSLVAV